MSFLRAGILFFLVAISRLALGQERFEMTKPLDLPQHGVYKVLCMKNGNTLLFHFENNKPIMVKVFDSTRKEVATQNHLCRILDILVLDEVVFKGLFEINNEAVLFFDQDHLGKHGLVRLRINSSDGTLIEEKLVAESKSENKRMRFYIMKNKKEEGYSILFSTDINHPRQCDIYAVSFNKNHESVKEIQLEVDRKKYDYLDVIGAESLDGGLIVTLGLSKLLVNGTISHSSGYDPTSSVFGSRSSAAKNTFDLSRFPADGSAENDEHDPTPNVFDHFLAIYYIPKDTGKLKTKIVDASTDVYPFHAYFANNKFANTINMFLLGYKDGFIRYGIELLPAAIIDNVFIRLDADDLATAFKWVHDKQANDYLKQKTDTNHSFAGLPIATFTNETGLSTIVTESSYRYKNVESNARPNVFEDYLGGICITQVDDNGEEIWGTILPKAQYYKSYRQYYYAHQLSKRWNEQMLLNDLPKQLYERQFVSANVYTRNRNFYVIYNDYGKNFNNNHPVASDTIYTYDNTEAIYYKVGRKKEVTKGYLFGASPAREYKCSFIEGADFDQQRGVYATLVQYTKRNKATLCMAWKYFE